MTAAELAELVALCKRDRELESEPAIPRRATVLLKEGRRPKSRFAAIEAMAAEGLPVERACGLFGGIGVGLLRLAGASAVGSQGAVELSGDEALEAAATRKVAVWWVPHPRLDKVVGAAEVPPCPRPGGAAGRRGPHGGAVRWARQRHRTAQPRRRPSAERSSEPRWSVRDSPSQSANAAIAVRASRFDGCWFHGCLSFGWRGC